MGTREITLHHCRTHNLKDLSLAFPKNQLIALTGVSGSGKSSLAIDTLYSEGQRRYMESLGHSRALPRADVERIENLSPTIAVSQQQASYDSRQTPAHITDLYDLLALLLTQAGTFHSPTTGKPLHRHTQPEIVDALLSKHPEGTRLQLLVPITGAPLTEAAERLQKMGYVRARIDKKPLDLSSDPLPSTGQLEIVVDRLILKPTSRSRLADSVRTALELGQGRLIALSEEEESFSSDYYCEAADLTYPPITLKDFRPLKPLALALHFDGQNLHDLIALTPAQLLQKTRSWTLPKPLATELLPRIESTLQTLLNLALDDLPLDTAGPDLSTGEAQRLQLASELTSDLSGILYILDEPTRGLLPSHTHKLIALLKTLRDAGNTLLIVSHNPALIAAADHILELGPGSGAHGGEVIFQGTYAKLLKTDTPTGLYLSGRKKLTLGNLHLVDQFPDTGDERTLRADQTPIGITLRSLPISYIGAWPKIRTLFAETPLSRARGYSPAHFSLNKKGGRCESCDGQGIKRLKMGFLPDLSLPCDLCQGKRYNFETLQVTWKGTTLDTLLSLTFAEALPLFDAPAIRRPLQLATDLGLDYLQLGQPFPTLSGGEMQRLKLIAELARKSHTPTHYLLEEPSTGLHPQDLDKLLTILQRLQTEGHTVYIRDPNLKQLL